MGCDIHIVVEARERGSSEWVGRWHSHDLPEGRPRIARRDYCFFSQFAVRGRADHVLWPRNLPKDVSRLAWLAFMAAPTDHHSASFATPDEFIAAWLRVYPDGIDGVCRRDFARWDLLKIDADYDGDHRVVFWFDN